MESPRPVHNNGTLSVRTRTAFAIIDERAPALRLHPEIYGNTQLKAIELISKGFDLTSINLAQVVPQQFIHPEAMGQRATEVRLV